MIAAEMVLGLVTGQRVGELILATRNTRRLLAQGGEEAGRKHYPYMVALHAAWLAGLWVLARHRPIDPIWLTVFVFLQAARIWVVASLGDRWTTRVITLPGALLIHRGPYRFLSHPNYVVVAAEIAVLPLTFGLVGFALLFSALNAAMLRVRIGAEALALKRSQSQRQGA
ncbi:isoprenylcysteine carboxyl methyltransferase family protein [Phenylobacterium sp.]|jgi:methyltransferase|uniref:isoprenylcysteine carboxyl methyltransferase family protein n=1 Tax=Phenylobacterium sp. TaxID=1871053 RepID=UPI002E2FE9FA|nr:isoprenylcysteine carboxylmethyltransferase family protein [Phenylobacterium sp.]HEX3367527.1 isoprenylcysteine carboxylmethyltransferase family protein [Phenylobacterium sp.]